MWARVSQCTCTLVTVAVVVCVDLRRWRLLAALLGVGAPRRALGGRRLHRHRQDRRLEQRGPRLSLQAAYQVSVRSVSRDLWALVFMFRVLFGIAAFNMSM